MWNEEEWGNELLWVAVWPLNTHHRDILGSLVGSERFMLWKEQFSYLSHCFKIILTKKVIIKQEITIKIYQKVIIKQ